MANARLKDFLIGTLVGGVVGAATALLFAPKPGKELRADIAEGYQAVSEKTKDIAHAAVDRTAAVISRAKQIAGQVAQSVRDSREGDSDQAEEEDTLQIAVLDEELEQEDELVLIGRK